MALSPAPIAIESGGTDRIGTGVNPGMTSTSRYIPPLTEHEAVRLLRSHVRYLWFSTPSQCSDLVAPNQQLRTHESSKPHCVPACTQVSHVSVLLQPSTAEVDDAAGS